MHYSNHGSERARRVTPGVHGLSNAALDTAWPKVESARAGLARLLNDDRAAPAPLLDLLGDPAPASDESLPDTGVPREWERALSSVFIQTDDYGTRSSTALLIGHSGDVTFVERTFEEGTPAGDRRFSFRIGREDEKERK
jgi:uncharacterized protein with NRDE domain